MEIKSLFLTAFIVSSGVPPAYPENQIGIKGINGQINAGYKTRENIRNLFDSITKNDAEKAGTFRDLLEQETAREERAFRAIKEDLWLVRPRNAHKQSNTYKSGNEKAQVVKRRAPKRIYDISSSKEAVNPDKFLNPEDVHLGPCFDYIMEAYYAQNFTKVMAICEEFHRLAGMGYAYVEKVHLGRQWLAFQADPNYPPVQIDVLTYEIENTKRAFNGTVFNITSGVDTDCIFYMQPTPFNSTLLHLGDHVCGVSKAVFQ